MSKKYVSDDSTFSEKEFEKLQTLTGEEFEELIKTMKENEE